MTKSQLSRRAFLGRSALLGCSLAASPLITPVSFAAAPGENRLVVLILRGGMDGLSAVAPIGDPGYAALRGAVPNGDNRPIDLDGFYAMHPSMAPLLPMWQAGQLGFVHAVSTPYRDKRSHFDGQDLLEAGTASLTNGRSRDGWLNRMMQAMPNLTGETAYAIGHDAMPVLSGDAPVSNWAPDADLSLSPQAIQLAELIMHDDPLFSEALLEAFVLADGDGDPLAMADGEDMMSMMQDQAKTGRSAGAVAQFAARRLRKETRIAAFSLNGWDTHARQDRNFGIAMNRLTETLLTLQDELGPVWKKTTVVAMTEFGRTAKSNGTSGTDHGTAGAMILAGGALRGGRVVADWPGLDEASLYARRDLMPTRDVRDHAAWIMRGLFGFDRGFLENTVFPGLQMGDDPQLIL